LTVLLLWPHPFPLWFFTGIAAVLGVYVGTIPMDYEVCPQIFVPGWLRKTIIGLIVRLFIWIIFIGATVWMPDEFSSSTMLIGVAVTGLWVFWLFGGSFWVSEKLNLHVPAPERLQKIATEASVRMNVPFREVFLIRSPVAQAYAFPYNRKLAFTERLLEIAPDDEIAAICAHELAHLTESRTVYYARCIQRLSILPWMFFNPLIHAFNIFAFLGLALMTVGIPRLYLKLSHRMESRADQMAKAHESDIGTYARALIRIYEDNLTPAVFEKAYKSHPDLYDRVLAAGVTPDFPRPTPSERMAAYGYIFAAIMGFLFAIFAISLMQSHSGGFLH